MHFNVHASSLALSLLSHWLEGCCIIQGMKNLHLHWSVTTLHLQLHYSLRIICLPLRVHSALLYIPLHNHMPCMSKQRGTDFFPLTPAWQFQLSKQDTSCLWTKTKSRSINTQKKNKRTRPMSSHLDRTSLANKGFILWDKTPKHDIFSLLHIAHIPIGQ